MYSLHTQTHTVEHTQTWWCLHYPQGMRGQRRVIKWHSKVVITWMRQTCSMQWCVGSQSQAWHVAGTSRKQKVILFLQTYDVFVGVGVCVRVYVMSTLAHAQLFLDYVVLFLQVHLRVFLVFWDFFANCGFMCGGVWVYGKVLHLSLCASLKKCVSGLTFMACVCSKTETCRLLSGLRTLCLPISERSSG